MNMSSFQLFGEDVEVKRHLVPIPFQVNLMD